jgi:hypothetical protein
MIRGAAKIWRLHTFALSKAAELREGVAERTDAGKMGVV